MMHLIEEKQNSLIPKLFLAPFFLFASYFFIPHEVYVNKLLPIAGIFLCLLLAKKGLYLAFLLVGIDSIFQQRISESHLWLFGFEMSLALSFWIFYLAYEEAQSQLQTFEENRQHNELKSQQVQEALNHQIAQCKDTIEKQEAENRSLNESIQQVQLEMQSYLQLIDTLKSAKELEIQVREDLSKQIINHTQTINELEFELSSYKGKLNRQENALNLEKERNELIDELNYFRVKQFQTTLINEAFAYFVKEEIQKMKQKQTPAFDKEKYQKTRQLIGNYSQLKKQFKEKNNTLHLVRKQLYDLTTQYEVLKNTLDEKELSTKPIEQSLLEEVAHLSLKNTKLLQENQELEQIINQVFSGS